VRVCAPFVRNPNRSLCIGDQCISDLFTLTQAADLQPAYLHASRTSAVGELTAQPGRSAAATQQNTVTLGSHSVRICLFINFMRLLTKSAHSVRPPAYPRELPLQL
jgi:hypothetical protein